MGARDIVVINFQPVQGISNTAVSDVVPCRHKHSQVLNDGYEQEGLVPNAKRAEKLNAMLELGSPRIAVTLESDEEDFRACNETARQRNCRVQGGSQSLMHMSAETDTPDECNTNPCTHAALGTTNQQITQCEAADGNIAIKSPCEVQLTTEGHLKSASGEVLNTLSHAALSVEMHAPESLQIIGKSIMPFVTLAVET